MSPSRPEHTETEPKGRAAESEDFGSAPEIPYRAMLDAQADMVSLARLDGTLVYVNAAYARAFGKPVAEMVGSSLYDFVSTQDVEAVRKTLTRVTESEATMRSENRMRFADGTEHRVAWTNGLLTGTGRRFLHSVGTDITEVKGLEQKLIDSESFLRRLTDHLPLRIAYLDRDRRYRFVNQAFLSFFGRAHDEVHGRTRAELRPQDDDSTLAQRAAAALAGEVQQFEYDEVVAGQLRRFENRLIPDRAETGEVRGFFVTGIDITERARAEQALRTLTAIFDATTDYVVQTDPQGRLVYLNPAARRRCGIAPDAPIDSLTVADMNPPETVERHRQEIVPAALAKGVWVGESVSWDAEHNKVPVSHIVIAHRDKHSKVELFSAIMRDISQAKAAERAMRDSEHRLRMVTDHLPVLISYLDSQLQFRFVNKTYGDWFAIDTNELIGMSVRQVYGDEVWEVIGPHLQSALAGQEVSYEREMVRPEGRRRVQVTVVPDRAEGGEVIGLFTLISDITSFRSAQQALLDSEARLRTVADALPMRVAYIDAEERYRFNNAAYEQGFGRAREQLYGRTVHELLGDAAYQPIERHIRSALRGERVTFQSELSSGKGFACFEAQYIPQFASDGRTVLGFHAVITDITRQKLEERRLVELARVDPLTGIANRMGFELRLEEAMARCRTSGTLMALMYLDIDHFKQVNDQLGHLVGDALLRAFAGRLSQSLRATDSLARLGGDEFTVILGGLSTADAAAAVAAKIVAAMSQPFALDGRVVSVTTSIGVTLYRDGLITPAALVEQADEMLYAAKGAGRNNYKVRLNAIEGGRD